MIMKFSELMLDYATGDACRQDAYIQEALGQINVSNAIYESALEIMRADRDELNYIQEAAAEAGLPTDRDEALDVAQEAFVRSSNGFLNLIQQTTSKLGDAADKSWKAICGAARITGVPDEVKSEGLDSYAKATAKAIARRADADDIYLSSGFKDGTSFRTNAGLYMKSIQDLLPAFGLKANMNGSVVTEYAIAGDSSYTEGDLNKFVITMEYATASLGKPVRESYGAGVSDLTDYIKTAYTLKTFCESVSNALSDESIKKSASDYAGQNAGNGVRSQVAMESMQDAAGRIVVSTNILAKSLNDSGYGIGESINGGVAPLPQA
jgi:hypothetical protein